MNFSRWPSFIILVVASKLSDGRPFQGVNDGDVLYTSTKTTVVSKARVIKSHDDRDTIRPDNVVGVVFGSAGWL